MHHDPDTTPGMFFVDRYMPGASVEEREAAHENVRRLVAVLLRINDRILVEERVLGIRQSEAGTVESGDRFDQPAP